MWDSLGFWMLVKWTGRSGAACGGFEPVYNLRACDGFWRSVGVSRGRVGFLDVGPVLAAIVADWPLEPLCLVG